MEPFDLAIIFTAAGALIGAALISALVELLKRLGLVAAHGRAPMLFSSAFAAGLVLLAAWSEAIAIGPESILLGILAWLNVTTAAIGTHASVRKAGAIASGSTNTGGPDPEG